MILGSTKEAVVFVFSTNQTCIELSNSCYAISNPLSIRQISEIFRQFVRAMQRPYKLAGIIHSAG